MGELTANKDGQDDLAILFPERQAVIGDRQITMREYTFAESLRHHARIAALTDAMTRIALARNFHDLDSLRPAFGDHWEDVIELIAIACNQPAEWVRGLDATEGARLQLLWWEVNGDFFLGRVLTSVQLHKVRELDGRTSSTPLSPQDTTPAPSAATPTAS